MIIYDYKSSTSVLPDLHTELQADLHGRNWSFREDAASAIMQRLTRVPINSRTGQLGRALGGTS